MSSYPRRSARLSPHQPQDQIASRSLPSNSVPSFTHYSHPSSTLPTSYPSPSNNSSNPPPPPPTPMQPQLRVQAHLIPQQQTLNAPLPSPSASELDPFFSRPHSQPNPYVSPPTAGFSQQGPSQQDFDPNFQGQPPQNHPHTNSVSQIHPPNLQGMPGGQLPPDFLAEAAKRAQIACLMRDLGDVSL